jgi:hypothetical protein
MKEPLMLRYRAPLSEELISTKAKLDATHVSCQRVECFDTNTPGILQPAGVATGVALMRGERDAVGLLVSQEYPVGCGVTLGQESLMYLTLAHPVRLHNSQLSEPRYSLP